MAKAKKRRKPVRKQSGNRASSGAARLLKLKQDRGGQFFWIDGSGSASEYDDIDVTKAVLSVCASVLSQDETKGIRK